MPTYTKKLLPNNYYHIYTRGINSCNIFKGTSDYEKFLYLYEKFIYPVADTLAWVLMPNHVHFLVRIKSEIIYKYTNLEVEQFLAEDNTQDFKKWETTTYTEELAAAGNKTPNPASHFGHLFGSYSKYFNLIHLRHGSLLEHPFKRKQINSLVYLRRVLLYIHNNPVHHGFCNDAIEYPWSSHRTLLSNKETKILRDDVLTWFANKNDYQRAHNINPKDRSIENWLGI